MQLPVQGRFEEAPGWALRPAWGRQYGRGGGGSPDWGRQYGRRESAMALRPGSMLARQNDRLQWGRSRMPEAKAFLRGLGGFVPPMPSDPFNPMADYTLKQQWASQYYPQSVDYANAVVAALRSMGFGVQLLGNVCDPAAGCVGMFLYSAVVSKDGKSMDASIGNPVRFDSPQQEADYISNIFSMTATASGSFESGLSTQLPVQTAAPSAPEQVFQTAAPQSYTAAYRKDAQILAPDGYRTGGRFTLKIWGKPGQTVEVEAWQNGQSHGRTAFGTTDPGGYYEISGSWQAEHAGRWQENVYVGGEPVGRLDFEIVNPAQATQPGNVTVTPDLTPASQPPQPGGGTPDTGSGALVPGLAPDSGGGGGFPWLLLVGGGLALILVAGGNKGR